MDVIDRAISKGWHLSNNSKLNFQTWEEFENIAQKRDIFLFGVGDGADFYFYHYQNKGKVEQIIDNNEMVIGQDAGSIIGEIDYGNRELKIADISVLKQYDVDRIVVLITSLKHYQEIAEQLEKEGIEQYFAILPMEANKRKKEKAEEREDRIACYVRESCKKAINKKKLIFYTMGGYSGHGKYIVQELLKLRNDLDIVWVVHDLSLKVPEGVRLVYSRNRKRYIDEMETAGFWIFDNTVSRYIAKRPEQVYVQIKHWSSITLKTFGFDYSSFRKETSKIAGYQHDSEMMDYIITGSKFDEESCRRAFHFSGEVFEAGSPRSDVLFRGVEVSEKIYCDYQIEPKKRLLLYAPTFRLGKGEKKAPEAKQIDLDFALVKKELENTFGGEWVILLRLHPNVASQSHNIQKPSYVIDVSDYSDSQELVAASDVMITDYSSIMFEPAFVKKPVFLFATDKREYINGERELLIDYDTLPFPIAESNEELVQKIRYFDKEVYEKIVKDFLFQYGIHEDGHASERAAIFLSRLIDKK